MNNNPATHSKGIGLKEFYLFFIAVLLIGFAFCFPYLVFRYEDRRTSNYDIHYAAEKVELEDTVLDLYEKLLSIPEYYSAGSLIYLTSEEGYNIESNMKYSDVYDKAIDDFIDVFIGPEIVSKINANDELIKPYGSVGAYLKQLDYNVYPAYIIRTVDREMFLVWVVDVYNEYFDDLEIVIDDETEKILSFKYLANEQLNSDVTKDFQSKNLTSRIISYYNLSPQNIRSLNLKLISDYTYDDMYMLYYNSVDDAYLSGDPESDIGIGDD